MTLAAYMKACSKNVGGNSRIFLAEAANITSVTVTSGEVSAITAPFAFKEIQAELDSIIRTEEAIALKASRHFISSVAFSINKPSTEVNTLRDSLVNASPCGIVALLKDGNGTWWLVGYNEIDELTRCLFLEEDNMNSGAEVYGDDVAQTIIKLSNRLQGESLPLDSTLAAQMDAETATFVEFISSPIPSYSTALFWLDGTILNDGGTYYLKDAIGSRDFLITGYDFSVSGYPYKTGATISAPAADATLIAADVNNFLYDSGGTPNDIPVVSFFQNIEFADKLFSRHVAQVVDGNGVETTEPMVVDIVLYSSALTGDTLTLANNYYEVPTEDANAVWADSVNGDDGTGDGSKGNPYQTFRTAYLAAYTSQYPVYLKTGEYVRGGSLSAYLNCLGVGFSVFKDTTSPVLFPAGTDQKFEGLIIDGDSTAAYGLQTTGAGTTEVTRCKFQNCTSYDIYNGISGTVWKYNIFSSGYVRYAMDIDTCYYGSVVQLLLNNDDDTLRSYNIVNSKIVFDGTSLGANKMPFNIRGEMDIVFKGNYIETEELISFYQRNAVGTNDKGSFTFSYNTCIDSNNGSNLNYLKTYEGTYEKWLTVTINDNNITLNDDVSYMAIANDGNDVVNIYNNNILTKGTTSGGGIFVVHANTLCDIYNNRVEVYSGGAIAVGDETTQYTFACNVYNNSVIGAREQADYADGGHAIFIKRVPDVEVSHNFVKGFSLGIVRKGKGDSNTTGYSNYNVIVNCGGGLLSKGQQDLLFYGNTIVNDGSYPTTLSWYGGQVRNGDAGATEPGSGCIFKNNIITDIATYTGGAAGWGWVIEDAESETDTEIDYNNVYLVNSTYMEFKGVDKNFAETQALGYDVNGDNSDPDLSSNHVPNVGSSAIGMGISLSALYDDGLLYTTNWGDSNNIPRIITNQQTGSWDVGAFIS